jgi:hypothetical protein
MSLINDALKRAKETQPEGSSAECPSMQHVPTARRGERPDYLMPMLAGVFLLLAGLLFWAWSQTGGAMKVRANTIPAAQANQVAMATPAAEVAKPVEVAAAAQPAVVALTGAIVEKPGVVSEVTTNLVTPVVAALKPEPPAYRLQGIFYSKHPSAVINGKTVYAGSRIGEAHVVSIGIDSAMIVLATGEKKVLELP